MNENQMNEPIIPVVDEKKSKTVLWVILSIIMTALFVGGAMYFWSQLQLKTTKDDLQKQINVLQNKVNEPVKTPTEKPTSENTNTDTTPTSKNPSYTIQKFGISFNYPSTYTLINTYENTKQDESALTLYKTADYQAMQQMEGTEGPANIGVRVFKNTKNLTAVDWARQNNSFTNFETIDMVKPYKTKTILGEQAITYTWNGLGSGDNIVFTKNGYAILLSVTYYDEKDSIRDVFTDLVSTVAFK